MTTLASLDSNVLLRFAMKDVPEQFDRALALLSSRGTLFRVAGAVWPEIAYALERHYGLNRPQVADVLTSLAGIDNIKADETILSDACRVYVTQPKLSFTDCYLAAEAAISGAAPLYTFDAKLARQHASTALVP